MTSPPNAAGQSVVYFQWYAVPYTGSYKTHFEQMVQRIVGGMTSINSRTGVSTEDYDLANGATRTLWKEALNVTNKDNITVQMMIAGYRATSTSSQLLMMIFADGLTYDDPQLVRALDNIADMWKAGRSVTRTAAAAPPPAVPALGKPQSPAAASPPVPSPPKTTTANAPPAPSTGDGGAKPCVGTPVRINYPRAVSRQRCGMLGGSYQCSYYTDWVDNYVTVRTGCP